MMNLEGFLTYFIEFQIEDARKRNLEVLLVWLISELQNVSVNTLNFSRIGHYGISTQNITYLR